MMIGGDLHFHISQTSNGFPEKTAKFYTANLLLGLEQIHKHNIVHRDIKPANVLLNEKGYACISDFNVAAELDSEGKARGWCGTRAYIVLFLFLFFLFGRERERGERREERGERREERRKKEKEKEKRKEKRGKKIGERESEKERKGKDIF